MAEPKDSPVDELLRAEDEANKVIAEAKAEQDKKIKGARLTAEQEITLFRKEEEERYKKEIEKRFNQNTEEEDLENKTKQEIKKIYQDYENNKSKVVDMLLDRIMNVELEIPEVLRGDFSKLGK